MFEVLISVPNPERHGHDTSEYKFKAEVFRQMIVKDERYEIIPNGVPCEVVAWETHCVLVPEFADTQAIKSRLDDLAPDWRFEIRERTTPEPPVKQDDGV